jgi:hypothetical protein|tara:strand:+ start:10900 stop:11562 length:663 start_codon:yes stop_codon:yes gene_type:complete
MAFKNTLNYVDLKSTVTFTDINGLVQYVNLSAVDVILDAFSKNLFFVVGHPNAEIFAVSEVLAVTFSKVLADTPVLEEQAAIGFTLGTRTESVSVSESFSKVTSFARAFTESLSLVDTASNDDPLTTDWSTGIGNSATLSESSAFALTTPASDSMTMSEITASSLAKALTDTPSLAEVLAYSFSTSAADSATISESISVLHISGANSVLNASPLGTFAFN